MLLSHEATSILDISPSICISQGLLKEYSGVFSIQPLFTTSAVHVWLPVTRIPTSFPILRKEQKTCLVKCHLLRKFKGSCRGRQLAFMQNSNTGSWNSGLPHFYLFHLVIHKVIHCWLWGVMYIFLLNSKLYHQSYRFNKQICLNVDWPKANTCTLCVFIYTVYSYIYSPCWFDIARWTRGRFLSFFLVWKLGIKNLKICNWGFLLHAPPPCSPDFHIWDLNIVLLALHVKPVKSESTWSTCTNMTGSYVESMVARFNV